MKKQVTIVPNDKSPINVLAELKKRTSNSWIFLHENVVENLKERKSILEELTYCIYLTLIEEINSIETKIEIAIETEVLGEWKPVYWIDSEAIEFTIQSHDPEEIFFLKMEA